MNISKSTHCCMYPEICFGPWGFTNPSLEPAPSPGATFHLRPEHLPQCLRLCCLWHVLAQGLASPGIFRKEKSNTYTSHSVGGSRWDFHHRPHFSGASCSTGWSCSDTDAEDCGHTTACSCKLRDVPCREASMETETVLKREFCYNG